MGRRGGGAVGLTWAVSKQGSELSVNGRKMWNAVKRRVH